MTEAVPNLWPKKFSRGILTPLAVLRVQAAKFKEQTDGLLEAEVNSSVGKDEEGKDVRIHSFEIIASALDFYRRVILTAEHDDPGAYPVYIRSDFVVCPTNTPNEVDGAYAVFTNNTAMCYTQNGLFDVLRFTFGSTQLTTVIESLIAQINDWKQ